MISVYNFTAKGSAAPPTAFSFAVNPVLFYHILHDFDTPVKADLESVRGQHLDGVDELANHALVPLGDFRALPLQEAGSLGYTPIGGSVLALLFQYPLLPLFQLRQCIRDPLENSSACTVKSSLPCICEKSA